jgi:putative oxidoreductase
MGSIDRAVTSLWAQRISLLLLRITTGFLLVWFGLNKVVKGSVPRAFRPLVEKDTTMETVVSWVAGGAEVVIGALCVLGLLRKLALPAQALINGFTAFSVWWAIVDPFRWYIDGVDRIVFNSAVFYPTSITFAACILLIVFRHQDTLALDRVVGGR